MVSFTNPDMRPASLPVELGDPGVDLGDSRVQRQVDVGRGGSPLVVVTSVGVSSHGRRPHPFGQTELPGFVGSGLK
jgi:hypothetical protein